MKITRKIWFGLLAPLVAVMVMRVRRQPRSNNKSPTSSSSWATISAGLMSASTIRV